jgi:UDP-N-acetylmuramyl pentapeptide synthase
MPLGAAIGQVFAPYRPSRRHGHRFRHNKLSRGIVKSLFEASVQKVRNGPSTQLIEVTSCVERLNATIKAKEHCSLSSYQTLTKKDKNR